MSLIRRPKLDGQNSLRLPLKATNRSNPQWREFVLFDGSGYVYDGSSVDYPRAFLIPGVLLPNLEHISGIAAMLMPQPGRCAPRFPSLKR